MTTTIKPKTRCKPGETVLYVHIDQSIDTWLEQRAENSGRTKKAEVNRILKRHMVLDDSAA